MAVTPPPGYTPPPAEFPQRGNRATFSGLVDQWITWFTTIILGQLVAMIANAYANAVDAAASAVAAMGYRDTALTYRDAAQAARDLAEDYRDAALTYRDQAAASAAAAATSATASANSAASLTATSTTALAVGIGTRVFTVPAGKQFTVGVPMVAASVGTPANKMFGPVVSYTGTALTLNITDFEGSGTSSDWAIAPAGAKGNTGGTAGGTLTGAINEKKGSDLASAATIDPWSTGGNLMDLTGSLIINAIAAAPQAGARRTWIVRGAPTITNSANVIVKGGTTTLSPGDEVDIEADTTTRFLLTVRRFSGSGAIPVLRNAAFITTSGPWVAPRDGVIVFHAKGSDGTGGVAASTNTAGSCCAASGGAAAGYAVKVVNAKAGDSFDIVTGARAAGVSVVGSGSANGNAGSTTTVTGPGISVTCTGGGGGLAVRAQNSAIAAGAVGGTATGGDYNFTGGGSGTATATAPNSIGFARAATGGGAFAYRKTTPKSGDATATTAFAFAAYAATGGAGVGGDSGAAVSINPSDGVSLRSTTGGGGAAGASASDSTSAQTSPGGVGILSVVSLAPLQLNGTGSEGRNNNASPPSVGGAGAGTGAFWISNAGATMATPVFGASGAVHGADQNNTTVSGAPDYGGGSGAVAVLGINGGPGTNSSGAGGQAWVLVQYN